MPRSRLETLEARVIASDLSPYSLISSALSGLVMGVEIRGQVNSWDGYDIPVSTNNTVLPWMVSQLSLTLRGDIAVSMDDISIHGSRQATYSPSGFTRTYDSESDTTTATWNVWDSFSSFGTGESLALQFHNSIHDSATGGAIGSDFVLGLGVLYGDTNRDGYLNTTDLFTFLPQYAPGSVQPYNTMDINLNGFLDSGDLFTFNTAYGASLPTQNVTLGVMAPSGLVASPYSRNAISLAWTNSDPATGIRVERSRTLADAFSVVADLPPGTSTYLDSGLSAGTSYRYRLVAYAPAEPSRLSHASAPAAASTLSESLSASALADTLLGVEVLGTGTHVAGPTGGVSSSGFALGLGSSEPTWLPWSQIGGFRARFRGNVMVSQDDLAILGSGAQTDAFERTYNAATDVTTATWHVPGASFFSGGSMLLQFHNSIQANGGTPVVGPDFSMQINFLPGDFDQSGSLEAFEDPAALPTFNATPVGAFVPGDINLDGFVNALDASLYDSARTLTLTPAVIKPLPSAPMGLSAEANAFDEVVLSWQSARQPFSSPASALRVERAEGALATAGFIAIGALDASDVGYLLRSYIDPTVAGGTTYTYRLVALSGTAESVPCAAVSITAPVPSGALVGDTYSIYRGRTLAVGVGEGVLVNDGRGTTGDAVVQTAPAHGSLSLSADGSFTYEPLPGFVGIDNFAYSREGDSETVATVVLLVCEPPLMEAFEDSYTASQGRVLTVSDPRQGVLSNDLGVIPAFATTTVDYGPDNGTVVMRDDGTFDYTPAPWFVGTDYFYYSVTDGEQMAWGSVSINVLQSPPETRPAQYSIHAGLTLTADISSGLRAFATDAGGDPLTFSLRTQAFHGTVNVSADGSFVYTPHSGYAGDDSFSYFAGDGVQNTPGVVSIRVHNAAPVPSEDAYTVRHGSALSVPGLRGLLMNDSDPDGDTVRVPCSLLHGRSTARLRCRQMAASFTCPQPGGWGRTDSCIASRMALPPAETSPLRLT